MGATERSADHPTERLIERPPDLQSVLRNAFGVGTPETEVYLALTEAPESTVGELADRLNRDRSTVNRSLRTLLEKELVNRHRRLLSAGGHVYKYTATPLPEARELMHEALEAWAEDGHEQIEAFGSERP